MKKTSHLLYFFAILATLAVTFGCTGGTEGSGISNNEINWEDSALVVVGPVETYFFNDEIDSLLMVAPQVLDFCHEHEVWWVYYGAWERKAEAFAWQGDYDRAAEEADGMRRDAEHRGNDYGQAMAYYVLAQGYAMQNNYDEAIPHYKRAIDLYPEGENPSMLANIYSTYAEVLAMDDDYERMDSLMPRWKHIIDSKSVTGTDAHQDDIVASWRVPFFNNLFMRDFNKGDFAAAARDLDSADYYNGYIIDVQWNAIVNLRHRSKLANAQGHYDEALALIDSAMVIGRDMGPTQLASNLSERIGTLYGLGRYHEAFDALRQQKTLGDSITQADNREQLNLLNKRFEVNELKMQAERHQLYLFFVIILLALVGGGLFAFYRYRSAKRLAKMRAEQQRIEGELKIARDIQMSMVPSTFPEREGLDMYASMTPAKEVGGDLYGYVLNDTHLYFALGDVSGKGVPASLFMAQATRLFRTLAAQQMVPAEICTRMNKALSGEDNTSGMFVTMFIGMLDLQTGHLDFCNAGHNPPVIGVGLPQCDFLDMLPNAPIGLWPGLEYEGEEIDTVKGRPLFIYTDGLNEAENTAQEQFGDDRLLAILRDTRFDSARQVIETLAAEVEKYRNSAEPNDDLTMMCLMVEIAASVCG